MKNLIDSLTKLIGGTSDNLAIVYTYAALQIFILILDSLLTSSSKLLNLHIQQKMTFHFENEISQKTFRMPYMLFESNEVYNRLQRLTMGFGVKGFNVLTSCFYVVKNVITLTGFILVLLSFHWILAVGIIVTVIPSLVFNMRFGELRLFQLYQQTPNNLKSSYLMKILKEKEVMKETKLYGHSNYLLNKWIDIYFINAKEKFDLERRATTTNFLISSIGHVITLIVTLVLIWFCYLGKVTIGAFVAFIQAFTSSINMLNTIVESIATIYEDALLIQEFFAFQAMPEQNDEERQELFPDPLSAGIFVNNLTFHYKNSGLKALDNVSLSIKPGDKVAIVGENGSGKSTLIKCLLGLYEADEGTIYFDNKEIRQIKLRSLQENIAVVFQDFVRYHLTARENIGFGSIEDIENQTRIELAASMTGADDTIQKLKSKYETQLGPEFLGGQDISGGQWQKIALSRAYMGETQVIIFDEPTAALDPIAEVKLINKMMELAGDKTLIFISHRLGSCVHADHIFVLKDGCIEEEGTHEQLLSQKGLYCTMFNEQAQWYTESKFPILD
ncbi:MAG: ABC transporter ATP-binding protein [Paenibacillus dendritiformis]|uniref:ABC transporter ATP-binding protein n=1 Tax=uncultured Paenibacillus sp. TaxID=227322 RepID=UPI0025F6ECD0|nr:ABC transporter ATP-binding protein [uncultured Paenibacillus sp.]MDU5145411.1 ABC transporter ATP-binding protein [Paenibacillus dendritiformis]